MATFGTGLRTELRAVEGSLAGGTGDTVIHTATADRISVIVWATAGFGSIERSRSTAGGSGGFNVNWEALTADIINKNFHPLTSEPYSVTAGTGTDEDKNELRILMPGEQLRRNTVGTGATTDHRIYIMEFF